MKRRLEWCSGCERGRKFSNRGGGGSREKDGFRFRYFFVFFPDVVKIAPSLKIQCSMVFIGKVLLGFQISPSTFPFLLFSSFFVNFDFSYFFCIFESEQISTSTQCGKSMILKMTREKLNAFQMSLKI